jgi:23S rRNA pseudouridine1911/1915/1917 synthase
MSAAEALPAALNDGWTYRDRVPLAQAGLSVTAFYALRYHHSDAATWARRLAAGEIRCNGEILQRDGLLVAGDRLAWRRPPWLEPSVPAAWAVVHDDGDLLVIDKPSGLPVMPAGGWLEHTVLRLLERRHRGDPNGVPRPVHRLGRFTSGLLVCARRPATRAWLSAALRESTAGDRAGSPDPSGAPAAAGPEAAESREAEPRHMRSSGFFDRLASQNARGGSPSQPWRLLTEPGRTGPREAGCAVSDDGGHPVVRKLYRAVLVPGVLSLEPGEVLTLTTPIGRRPHPRLGWIWCASGDVQPGDLPALSHLTLLERRPGGDLVQVAIGSGRPHQIRIHCAAMGAPLLGDPLYRPGGTADPAALPGDGGYRLQAWRLELLRPDGEELVLQVPQGLALEPAAGGAGPSGCPAA